MKIIVPINPVPASRPRVTRWGVYYGKKHTQYIKDTTKLIKQCKKPKNTPVKVEISFYIQIPKSKSESVKNKLHGQYHISTPDIDNLEKLILDILTNKGYWQDDSIIASLTATKKWTKDNPRTEITISDL